MLTTLGDIRIMLLLFRNTVMSLTDQTQQITIEHEQAIKLDYHDKPAGIEIYNVDAAENFPVNAYVHELIKTGKYKLPVGYEVNGIIKLSGNTTERFNAARAAIDAISDPYFKSDIDLLLLDKDKYNDTWICVLGNGSVDFVFKKSLYLTQFHRKCKDLQSDFENKANQKPTVPIVEA